MTACLSIAMATRNSEAFVGEALASIQPSLGPSGLSYEVLLADGQSEDRTVEIAAAHANVRVVSHSDHGIYDGMNRAIAAARGEFLLILNSDDLLLPNGLSRLVASLRANPRADCATGRVLIGSAATAATELTNQRAISVEGILFGVPVINARLLRVRSVARLGRLSYRHWPRGRPRLAPTRGPPGVARHRRRLPRLFLPEPCALGDSCGWRQESPKDLQLRYSAGTRASRRPDSCTRRGTYRQSVSGISSLEDDARDGNARPGAARLALR